MKKILCLLALCWMALLPVSHAQEILFLSPDESVSTAPEGGAPQQALLDNSFNAFNNNPLVIARGGMVDGRNRLSDATVDMSLFNGIKLVIVGSVRNTYSLAWRAQIIDMMLNRPDLVFIMYPDGCCHVAATFDPLISALNQGTGWNLTITHQTGSISSRLNTNSLYANSFSSAGLDPLVGFNYRLINNVPADNALYLAQGVTAMPAAGTLTSAYALFVPQKAMNNGDGACIFFTGDISAFNQNAPTQPNNMATAFYNAAFDPNGACSKSTREPDLEVVLTGPATLTAGSPGSFLITINNLGATNSAATTVSIALPAGFTTSNLPPACTVAANTLTCTVNTLTALTGTESYSFNGLTQQAGALSLTADVVPVTGETNTANNTSSLNLQATAASLPATVPSLGMLAMFVLALSIVSVAMRHSTH